MSRQTLYIVILSLILTISVVIFSVFFLIPKGKEYRSLRLENKKEIARLELIERSHDQTRERLETLKKQNTKMLKAFSTPFNPETFSRKYSKEFTDLYLSEVTTFDKNGSFTVYEVNATSKITSPQSFYTFLDGINQSEWIIGVNFPIHFVRDGDKIRSSFRMKVYNNESGKKE